MEALRTFFPEHCNCSKSPVTRGEGEWARERSPRRQCRSRWILREGQARNYCSRASFDIRIQCMRYPHHRWRRDERAHLETESS